MEYKYDVSIIVPIFNGEKWINDCFNAITNQNAIGKLKLEICVTDDGSTDSSSVLLQKWSEDFKKSNINCIIYTNNSRDEGGGVGYAKNHAVACSTGKFLCFQDVDDVMCQNRILSQYEAAITLPTNTLIGSKFEREPSDSTLRYTRWANSINEDQLCVQIYTSHGPTIIMPTWFCHRDVFDRVGGFSEKGQGTPEDLIFFYAHLDNGGNLFRVDENLLVYRYHPEATTFSIHEDTIWDVRLERFQKEVLSKWNSFTIWNAGKQGRRLYNSLNKQNKKKLSCFCDVDKKKINKHYIPFDPVTRKTSEPIKIVHFTKAKPPFVLCVKQDLTDGEFEKNLQSMCLTEGQDFMFF